MVNHTAMDPVDISLLMEAQYDFPLVERPFRELGRRLELSEEEVLSRLRRLTGFGILKRIGAALNYRARGLVAALVALSVPDDAVDAVAQEINRDRSVSHNFLRDHYRYNVWYVTKARTPAELEAKVRSVVQKFGIRDYLILYGLRTLKLDVKFDLREGVSRSKNFVLPDSVPSVDDVGLPIQFFSTIKAIPIEPEPFKRVAEMLGISVGKVLDLIAELRGMGVVRDFYAVLNGEAAGFTENAMVVIDVDDCEKVAVIPEATHVVQRHRIPGKWNYPCYFMIHGRDRRLIERIVDERMKSIGNPRYEMIFSVRNLLGAPPGDREV